MDESTLIDVDDVSKRFSRQLQTSVWRTLGEMVGPFVGRKSTRDLREDEFWALRDVTFRVQRGESVAVIGDNGAGKSTLVKLLMGRMLPTSGSVETRGSISALAVLGLGFDPSLSGRENIYINGATLGLTRAETNRVMEDIVEFAELNDFIDVPVQSYSSGMRARLGYAVAAHVHPDILLLDEVLAVGDVRFRRKCRRHIKNFVDGGGTILLVTHDMHAVQTICTRCIVLDHGRLVFDGSPTEGVHFYLHNRLGEEEGEAAEEAEANANSEEVDPAIVMAEMGNGKQKHDRSTVDADASSAQDDNDAEADLSDAAEADGLADVDTSQADAKVESNASTSGSTSDAKEAARSNTPYADKGKAATTEATTSSTSDGLGTSLRKSIVLSQNTPTVIDELLFVPESGKDVLSGDPVEIVMRYRSLEEYPEIVWGITFCTEDGLTHIGSVLAGFSGKTYGLEVGGGEFRCRIPKMPLHAGRYVVKTGIAERDSGSAIANIGWEDAPVPLVVKAKPSPENNIHFTLGELIRIDAEFVESSTPVK